MRSVDLSPIGKGFQQWSCVYGNVMVHGGVLDKESMNFIFLITVVFRTSLNAPPLISQNTYYDPSETGAM